MKTVIVILLVASVLWNAHLFGENTRLTETNNILVESNMDLLKRIKRYTSIVVEDPKGWIGSSLYFEQDWVLSEVTSRGHIYYFEDSPTLVNSLGEAFPTSAIPGETVSLLSYLIDGKDYQTFIVCSTVVPVVCPSKIFPRIQEILK